MSKRIAVIGAGAAGLIAAGEAASRGAAVTLFEKNDRLGKKLVITGKGRCNLTNLCDVNEFIRHVPCNGKFLYSALNLFPPDKTYEFFESRGVPLKVERGRRVFPQSDRSFDIVDALRDYCKSGKVIVRYDKVKVVCAIDGRITGLVTEKGAEKFDSVIICTGGLSYPATGSDGDGFRFARQLGHTVTELCPSLVPLEVDEVQICRDMMGLSLKNVELTLMCGAKKFYSELGEMLFTHFGVSGPLVLTASTKMREIGAKYLLSIDLKPSLGEDELDKRILSDFTKNINRQLKNAFADLLPSLMIPVFCGILANKYGIDTDKKVNGVTKSERAAIIALLKGFTLTVTKTRGFDEAIITRGGVSIKEIDSTKMESKLVKGLYFAGEVIDVDAETGGYNLQIAFATGKLAAASASAGD
ncbi:lipoprotein [Clostridia bacterium]|nr:lipoprotein [Clostridia bacterium]